MIIILYYYHDDYFMLLFLFTISIMILTITTILYLPYILYCIYCRSHAVLNAYAVIPHGPNVLADLALPHNRA